MSNLKIEFDPKRVPADKALPGLLKGQKALVTGANSGIGKACALELGKAGG